MSEEVNLLMSQVNITGRKNIQRAALEFRMAGYILPFVRLLRKMLLLSSNSKTTDEDEQMIVKIASFLDSTKILLSDFEVSLDFAYFGGHQVLKRLSMSLNDTISTVATDLIGIILCCEGIIFPMATVVDVDTNPRP